MPTETTDDHQIQDKKRETDSLQQLLRPVDWTIIGFPTFQAEKITLATAWKAWHRFIIQIRKDTGIAPAWFACPEFQKRGAIHYSVLLAGIEPQYAEYMDFVWPTRMRRSSGEFVAFDEDRRENALRYVTKDVLTGSEALWGGPRFPILRQFIDQPEDSCDPLLIPYTKALAGGIKNRGYDLRDPQQRFAWLLEEQSLRKERLVERSHFLQRVGMAQGPLCWLKKQDTASEAFLGLLAEQIAAYYLQNRRESE